MFVFLCVTCAWSEKNSQPPSRSSLQSFPLLTSIFLSFFSLSSSSPAHVSLPLHPLHPSMFKACYLRSCFSRNLLPNSQESTIYIPASKFQAMNFLRNFSFKFVIAEWITCWRHLLIFERLNIKELKMTTTKNARKSTRRCASKTCKTCRTI